MIFSGTIFLWALAGCAGGPELGGDSPRVVHLAEFSQSHDFNTESAEVAPNLDASPHVDPDDFVNREQSTDAKSIDLIPEPEFEQINLRKRPLQAGEALIVDRMVGQVNGRPIFANDFFEPIEDELISLSEQLTPLQFEGRALNSILQRLRQVVLNELFLAEAESGLTSEQQQGVFAWLQSIEEQLYSEHEGSEAKARQQLRDEGLTVNQYLDDVRTQALISQLLRDKIQHRVIVSWRDVEREYQRHYDEFNPSPRLIVKRIRLNTTREADLINVVRERLAAGDSFAEVATAAGQSDEGDWEVFELGDDGVQGIELNDTLKNRLLKLEPGQTSPSFPVGRSTWWLHIAALEQPAGRPLYDPALQRYLAEQIRARRSNEEQNRYIKTLMKEGIFDELDTMAALLLDVAKSRYGP